MGIIGDIFGTIFGGGRNAIRETVEIFRPNAEAEAARDAAREAAALAQFAQEFVLPRQGFFDRLMDGLNRLPRPMLAFGTLGLFAAAMVDPVWFAVRMQGVALVPEPLWWLMGAIVSFYFGARHQTKSQAFQKGLVETLARTPDVLRNIESLENMRTDRAADDPSVRAPLDLPSEARIDVRGNAALAEWKAQQ